MFGYTINMHLKAGHSKSMVSPEYEMSFWVLVANAQREVSVR